MHKHLACAGIALALTLSAAPADAAYVCRLNPYGDNFLSLRQGPDSSYPEVMRMGPGTHLTVRSARGGWLYVEVTEDGVVGWAFARYVCQ